MLRERSTADLNLKGQISWRNRYYRLVEDVTLCSQKTESVPVAEIVALRLR